MVTPLGREATVQDWRECSLQWQSEQSGAPCGYIGAQDRAASCRLWSLLSRTVGRLIFKPQTFIQGSHLKPPLRSMSWFCLSFGISLHPSLLCSHCLYLVQISVFVGHCTSLPQSLLAPPLPSMCLISCITIKFLASCLADIR